ncbi:MarR family transcriptional regulator [Spiractinospora alimapuensis]|uniref:MarR family winged helix-turn-helix transcriptional regulator n=1 Tax=Spiractinospora alimapuensis TaxID=2820884 RepID=UPI001F38E1A1|nr:MarR family transcriptional regulator [Spiractinospora alimapuensis]QVQ52566.1 MarR family transcriptional regulator [Spiractinospora alimapuensis]
MGSPTDAVDRVLTQWHTQRPDLDPTPMGVIGRISRAAQLLDTQLRDGFATHGLNRGEFDILATLRRADPPHRLTAGALVASTMVTSGAITNRIDRLVAKNLVHRDTDPDNRRSVLIGLTDEGHQLIDTALVAHLDREQRLLSALTPTQRHQLADLLRTLLLDLGDHAPDND